MLPHRVHKPHSRRTGNHMQALQDILAAQTPTTFWGPGKRVVCRMYPVSPREGEKYYLRTMLTQIQHATSFDYFL